MSYRTEELLRRGRLATLRDELAECELRLRRLADELRSRAYPLDGVDKIDAEAVVQAAEELRAEQERLGQIKARMAELEG